RPRAVQPGLRVLRAHAVPVGREARRPSMRLNSYLSFNGRCREAFEFYEQVLGGKIAFIQTYGESPAPEHVPPDARDHVMHVTLRVGDQVLQGADAPPGQFTTPSGFCVAAHFDDAVEG